MASHTNSVKEGRAYWIDVTFLDKDGNPAAPLSATYEIHDVESEVEIKAATAITPISDSVTIKVASAENAIQNDANVFEARDVIVRANFGGDDDFVEYFRYHVLNLKFVS